MSQLGLGMKDLGVIFKTSGRTSEVIAKKRALNLKMIRRMSSTLNIPVAVLVQKYQLKTGAGPKPPGKQSAKAQVKPR